MLEIQDEHNLLLNEINLWLDNRKSRRYGFISHAHADHFARHERTLCSPQTAAILRKRFNIPKSKIQSVELHSPFEYKGYILELLPAGHITGSAMLHATRKSDNKSLLFTGDFKLRDSNTAEKAVFKKANHLVMESTFGLPQYVMPPSDVALSQLIDFVDESLAMGATPVVMAYALGKAQEAHFLLGNNGIAPVLHPSVAKMSAECIRMRIALPDYYFLDELCPERHCIIMPPGARKTKFLSPLGKIRTAMLTGWSMDKPLPSRYKDIDQLIPLSDHADYPDLIKAVELVQPDIITTVHGSTMEFAADLRKRGFNAFSATGKDQLDQN